MKTITEEPAPKTMAYQDGYAAGLASPQKSTFCPYDGRTRRAKMWWSGFMAGDAKRCADARERKGEDVNL